MILPVVILCGNCAFQLDDAEFSSSAAIKAKKRMELEIQDLHQQIEEFSRAKQEVWAGTGYLNGGLFSLKPGVGAIVDI